MRYDFALEAVEGDDAPRRGRRARRLRRQSRRMHEGELNIVSMIDVFAVLVFFLLVSSSVAAERLKALALELPGKAAIASAVPPRPRPEIHLLGNALVVDVGDGVSRRIEMTRTGYDLMALSTVLAAAKRVAPEGDQAQLMVAPEVAYEDLVAVMDAVRQGPDQGSLYPRIAVGDIPSRQVP